MEDALTPSQLEVAAKVLKAMAHPVRLGVMQLLSDGEQTVTQLYEALGCSQSMMSQQLAQLESHGLISTHKEGTAKYCSLRNRDFMKVFACMRNHLLGVLHLPPDDAAG